MGKRNAAMAVLYLPSPAPNHFPIFACAGAEGSARLKMAIHRLMGSTAPAAAQLGELAIALGSEVDLDAVLAQEVCLLYYNLQNTL